MGRTRWRLATSQDVADVVSRLRTSDEREVEGMFGVSASRFFSLNPFDPKRTYVIYNSEGLNVALAGAVPMGTTGQVWMVATNDLEKHPMEFLKHSRQFIEMLHEEFDLLWNWVDGRNDKHLMWLRWCGFTFIRKYERFGAQGIPAFTFVRIK